MNSPVRFSPVNRRNLENTNTIVRTDWNETKRCVILSLSSSFLFFPPPLSFFLFHSHSNSPKLPTENRKIEPEPSPFSTRVEQLALPPPSPRSVAVRTIIAAWIIAESNNKRPWSPPLPTGLLRDLTFVQRNGRDYELFTHPSLPPFETWRAIRKRKRRRCTRSVSLEIRGDISFFDGEEKIVEEFCIILYNVELKYWYLIYLYFKKEFFLCI